ncbi:MAG: YebC/PmpR family DNA-binding transcriptional regulator [Firmicutes bacterium]|jgi:YebC/PmpR family DNA-binding regulatory protein|nr:YebC/PmpR family DNA-binding transcriptional regulator [Bacillota bacterium]HQD40499.1 YebC/PmpR family DNA-binding transcriptional regulator [Bacillota bacterium]
MAGHSKWANIKRKKEKTDAARGRIFTKLSREILTAVRQAGPDPQTNLRLRLAIEQAKAANMPNDNINRLIKRASGGEEGANYEEIVYEGYGTAGVAVLVHAMTDNRNRTAADIRHLFSKYGGSLGQTGCVAWLFQQKGVFSIERSEGLDGDQLMMIALESGAEDFREEEEGFEIITKPEDFESVQQALAENEIPVADSEITMVPENTVRLSGEEAIKNLKLLEALEEHDDVQGVYANLDTDEVLP